VVLEAAPAITECPGGPRAEGSDEVRPAEQGASSCAAHVRTWFSAHGGRADSLPFADSARRAVA
jgi:hypothetical protein